MPRPNVVKQYFDGASQIDVHNHLRQGVIAIEDHVHTQDDIFRLFTTVFATCIVDAYKYFYMCNQVDRHKTIPDWIDQASAVLLTTRRAGCPDLTREQYVLRKRSNSALPAVVQPKYLAFVVRGVAVIVFRGTRQIPCSVVNKK